MNIFINRVKRLVPVSVKSRIYYHLSSACSRDYEVCKREKKVIVALAADYGNLGDVAITYAQEMFLKYYLPDYEVIDFPISSTFDQLKSLKKIVGPTDIITIVGGGNMGSLYSSIEDCRRFIIKNFPRNKIISFPQTIDFKDESPARRELKKTQVAYTEHQNFCLFAREPVSFESMVRTFPSVPVNLVPDIVLSLDQSEPMHNRSGVMSCIRKDAESALSKEDRATLMAALKTIDSGIVEADTHIGGGRFTISEREDELSKIWDSFRMAEVVVTDRLHGMIFAAITKTPCVVLQNNNHKIKSTYTTWLEPLPHIRLLSGFSAGHVIDMIGELKKIDASEIKLPDLAGSYESLKNALLAEA